MPIVMDLAAHLISALLLAVFFYRITSGWLWPVLGMIGGVLIDIDHFFDYFIFHGPRFSLKQFFDERYRKDGKFYVVFHSWEIIILLWIFSYRILWLVPLVTGMTIHLLTDCFFSHGSNVMFYSLLFRWHHKFAVDIVEKMRK